MSLTVSRQTQLSEVGQGWIEDIYSRGRALYESGDDRLTMWLALLYVANLEARGWQEPGSITGLKLGKQLPLLLSVNSQATLKMESKLEARDRR
jgi:hypothetical protein